MSMTRPSSAALPPVALIAGPTASGKSALALALALRTGGTIINADSAQLYRELRIVTARPSEEDEAASPHRLYGTRAGDDPASAADWAREAKAEIATAHAAGSLPILVGGTGLYLRTLVEGIAPVPEIDSAIRAAVRALPAGDARKALEKEDPEAAARLKPSDAARTARALEVRRSTGRSLTVWQEERIGGIADEVRLAPIVLLPPRDWLHERCDARFDIIHSEKGFAEVSYLLKLNYTDVLPVMRAIGVREIAAVLSGALDRETAREAGRIATRQYAKRQYTWFRRQPPAEWLRFEGEVDGAGAKAALELLTFGPAAP